MSYFSKLTHIRTIRTKFLIGLFLLASLVAIVGYVANTASLRTTTQYEQTVARNVPRLVALMQMKSTGSEIRADLDHFASISSNTSVNDTTDIRYELLAAIDDMQTAQSDYNRYNKDRPHNLDKGIDPVVEQTGDLVSLYGQNATASQLVAPREKLKESIFALQSSVNQAIDAEQYQLNKTSTALGTQAAATSKFIYFLTGLSFLSAIVIGFVMAQLILKPIARLKQGVALISQGELQRRIQVGTTDEIGQLATAFNDMGQKLEDSYHSLKLEKAGVEQKVVERTEELHEEQAKLRASIEGLALGFVLIDHNDRIVIQNKMLQTIFAISEPFTAIQQLEEPLRSFDLAAARRAVQAGKPFEAKEVSLGSKILSVQLSPVNVIKEGQASIIGTVILVEDITEAKVMSRSKDEFFSIASHELRTPLTAILGNASMIIDYHADLLKDPNMKEMVYDIHDASERLISIVGDFMDVSGLEQDKIVLKPEEFTLGPVVETVVYEMRTILEQKHLSLQVEPKTLGTLPPIWADKGRTKQVLYNLLSNALKFTEKGGASIRISTAGETMKIVVSDTGHGISEENQKLLFHKLQQAGDSLLTRDTTRGTGLGLYICKILVERMGGTIELESSELNKGSTFSVTLPLASAPRQQAPATSTTHIDTSTGLSM